MVVEMWEWIVLSLLVISLILFDLFGHVRKAHEPTIGEAARWTAVYVSLAAVFGVATYIRHGARFATEFFAGYITEYSLSLDNIFVFIIIIAAFKVPRRFQQKVLMWGIIIALVFRFIFIMIGAALVEKFVWIFFAFGVWMVYTAVKQVLDGLKEARDRASGIVEEIDYQPTAATKFISRVFPVTSGFVGDKLIHRASGKTYLTPLLICIISIGTIDLLFALDSIPAIFGLTNEPFIVFASNAFALLGLRQLFFLVDGLLDRLIYLHYGLAGILGFIGFKLLLHAFHGYDMFTAIPEPGSGTSVAIILTIIIITVIASLLGSRKMRKRSNEIADQGLHDEEVIESEQD
ncbi:TerC/Alx family metal homeostasis membrane protein [Arcanobacterium pinnipediorum]|uniref:TerC/Alx family metal homeostasis membrane protein n=1 Tax=Arcanobacterium pinnipediorum TaxID=1503041 RepID=A0ABY5AJ65_9ACTO|nr:TerC/Alx family metal homeostasis membrane protein [Arcanobacterium pinnipediorum]USR80238.1 TerC/Alx family metal homeostasis membrane protein [Arcanobacterium pinnipediorum]